MARVAADALGQQLLDLLARHVQLTQKVQEDAAGHLGEEKMERKMTSIGETGDVSKCLPKGYIRM